MAARMRSRWSGKDWKISCARCRDETISPLLCDRPAWPLTKILNGMMVAKKNVLELLLGMDCQQPSGEIGAQGCGLTQLDQMLC